MNKTVLASILAVAGAAASVQAQTFTIETRLVVDGSAEAPTGAGIDTFLPGAQATRVGLTVQARIVQNVSHTTAGVGNYGIAGVNNVSTAATGLARFFHNDTQFSGGTYQPFGRGRVSSSNDAATGNPNANADGLPLAGAFGSDSLRDFRSGAISNISGGQSASVNSLRGNDPQATGTNGDSANGFFPAGGQVLSFIAAVVPSLGSGLGTTPLFAVGTFSPWYNIYRAYFDPQPNNSDPIRNVTVSFFGRFLGATRYVASPVAQYTLGNPTGVTGGLLETTLTATFQVPTPGAAALLGLGGLIAARRRRA